MSSVDEDTKSLLLEVGDYIQSADPDLAFLAEEVYRDEVRTTDTTLSGGDTLAPLEDPLPQIDANNSTLSPCDLASIEINAPPIIGSNSSTHSGSDALAPNEDSQPTIGDIYSVSFYGSATSVRSDLALMEDCYSASNSPQSAVATTDSENSRSATNCAICYANACGWRYYGVVVCNSCRAFFSRAIKKDSYSKFKCSTGKNDCKIESKSWKSCQKCRFQRCIQSGMDLDRARQALRKRTEAKSEKRSTNKEMNKLCMQLENKLSMEEDKTIDKIIQGDRNMMMFETAKFYCRDMETFQTYLNMMFDGAQTPWHINRDIDHYMIYYLQKCYSSHAFPYEVSPEDKGAMMTRNYHSTLVMNLSLSLKINFYRYNKNNMGFMMKKGFLSEILQEDQDKIEAFTQVYNAKSQNGHLDTVLMTFDRAYPPEFFQQCNPEMRLLFRDTMAKLNDWPDNVLTDTKFMRLLQHLNLNSSDMLEIRDKARVEAVQAQITQLTYR